MTVRTLIVDDDVRVADIHKSYVEKVDGFEVAGIANRGTEALRRVLDDQPDLVLLDIYLPDLDGLEVCRRLRAAGNLVDVIAVTAARDVETVRAATGLGIAQYLVKPFAFATFREKLERYSAYRARASRGGEAGQDEIDAMLGELRSSTAIPLPKGLSRETLDLVARTLRDTDAALGAAETADAAGLSRVTARRYLEHLVSEGSVALELKYGTGRPEHRYRWSTASLGAVPSFRAAYLIHGDDHGRIAERRARLRTMAEEAAGSAGVEVYEADACTPENVAAALSTMTFALGRRFVIADGVERWKDSDVEPVAQATARRRPGDASPSPSSPARRAATRCPRSSSRPSRRPAARSRPSST